ncbi:hypothetical protein [Abyssisolibacter fermentans]|nr:hypothetical protein [Abyssisolibacter fermentans]
MKKLTKKFDINTLKLNKLPPYKCICACSIIYDNTYDEQQNTYFYN